MARFLMAKPATLEGYNDDYTLDCERVLVTLLRGRGPWKDSIYLTCAPEDDSFDS